MDDTVKTNNKMKDAEEAWEALSKGFGEAQAVLEQNRLLIRQVDDNHRSRLSDKLAENVSLIREINANISKVLAIYSHMSLHFSATVLQHRRANVSGDDESCSNSF